jgi:hypothetical protein
MSTQAPTRYRRYYVLAVGLLCFGNGPLISARGAQLGAASQEVNDSGTLLGNAASSIHTQNYGPIFQPSVSPAGSLTLGTRMNTADRTAMQVALNAPIVPDALTPVSGGSGGPSNIQPVHPPDGLITLPISPPDDDVTPVPEASTWLAGGLAAGFCLWTLRRKLRGLC